MPTDMIRMHCRNNVIIACFNEVFSMELNKHIVLIVEPNGENFSVMDLRTFETREQAVKYALDEYLENDRLLPDVADYYNGGRS